MNTISGKIDLRRGHLLGAVAMTAVAPLGMLASANAQPAKATAARDRAGHEHLIRAAEADRCRRPERRLRRSRSGRWPAVILLHGWPYDIHSFVDVAPLLASAGYRVLVPYLRGYGATRFLSGDTFRNGQPSALAVDTIAFMDALKIEKAKLAGFDWGARTANIVAALWPERVQGAWCPSAAI